MSIRPARKQHIWIWLLWLTVFYATWSYLVFGNNRWNEVMTHWPIAVAMAVGSYVAGSTPIGGGTIGFPILVLLFKLPATLGRDFSFAIQSIGMTSASVLILARRQPLATAMLQGAIAGSLIGTPVGIVVFAPLIPELWIKLLFAIIWASFGILHLYRIGEISSHIGMTEFNEQWDFRVGLITGFLAGATVASVTGVGIDMALYAVLVLICRADLKIAIPTSVVIMAFTSVIGIVVKSLFMGIESGVFEYWLAAAPIVALGAPLGALIVDHIGRKFTLLFVSVLCVGQFIWTCYAERSTLGVVGLAGCFLAVTLCLIGLERFRVWGGILVGERIRHDASRLEPKPKN